LEKLSVLFVSQRISASKLKNYEKAKSDEPCLIEMYQPKLRSPWIHCFGNDRDCLVVGFSFADAKLIRVALECMKRDFIGAGAVIDLEGMEIKFVKGK
jgi:hypothetical protein